MTGTLAANELLSGRYRIVKMVGKGGFGAVYQARDERFQGRRVVAIKEMSDSQLSPKERAQAIHDFRQEANLLVQLKHPNLPDVSDFFEEGGKAYLVMEFVEGETLEKIQEDANGPLDEKQVMEWGLQLCNVLNYLHTQPQPIIFRDMKPSNVMITKYGQIKLIDFGIARIFKSTATKDTTSLGSRGYAPFEQYGRGQTDERSDIYALGATLFDLLTKNTPTDAITRQLNPQTFETPRQLNPHISPATEQIVLKAMAMTPQNRYQSVAEMYQAIAASGVISAVGSGPMTGPNLQAGTYQIPPIASGPTGTYQIATPSAPTAAQQAPPQRAQQQQVLQPPPPTTKRSGISRRALIAGGLVAVVAAGGAAAYGLHLIPGTGGGGNTQKGTATSAPVAGAVTVNFYFSTEKQDWMNAVISGFQNQKLSSGQSINVQATPIGSVDLTNQILSGQIKPLPTAISTASQLELNQLNAKWKQTHKNKDITFFAGDLQVQSLVSSPLVFAVWKDRADVLLKKYKTIDWPAISDAITQGWQKIGGPAEWGRTVYLGQTLPTQSNSGLLALTLIAYAYIQQSNDPNQALTTTLVQSDGFQSYLKHIEDAVYSWGRSSGTYLDSVILAGPSSYDIIPIYENLVLTKQTAAQNRQGQALEIFYPSQNIVSDHPFAILNVDGVSNEQQLAAKQFLSYLLQTEQQKLALQSGFRPSNSAVQLTDTSIKNNPFPTLKSLSPNAPADIQQVGPLAKPPGGDVVDALIATWQKIYPNPPTALGDITGVSTV